MLSNIQLKKISLYFFILSLEAIFAGVYLLSIPADPKNEWLWGYSQYRILFLALFSILFVSFLSGAWFSLKNIELKENVNTLLATPSFNGKLNYLSLITLGLSVVILLIPEYRFRELYPYIERLRPLLWYAVLFAIQTFLLTKAYNEKPVFLIRKEDRNTLKISLVALTIISGVWILIAKTEVGVRDNLQLWGEAGVPILLEQILAGYFISILLLGLFKSKVLQNFLSDNHLLKKHKTTLIGLGIWLFTFYLWAKPPIIVNHFFFPGPYPPNYEFYPFADAATWDIFGQLALIGEGFASGDAFADHSGMAGFNAILHLLVGQNYEHMVLAQVGLYALFPVVLFLLGKHFYSAAQGVFLALLAVFHQLNAFASSNMIDQSNAKSMLTEFPTGLGLAAITLWLFLLHKNRADQKVPYIFPISGAVAMLILLRFNTLLMPVGLVIWWLIFFGKDWKASLRLSLLSFLTIMIIFSPWMWRSWKVSGNPFFFAQKPLNILDKDFRMSLSTETIPANQTEVSPPRLSTRQLSINTWATRTERDAPIINATLRHFTNSIITSVEIFPTYPFFHDLKNTIYKVSPYWNKLDLQEREKISRVNAISLLINLAIISIGLGYSWKKWRLSGLIPLVIYFLYITSTALARTSGGRYIVPIQWVTLFYFSLGFFTLLSMLISSTSTAKTGDTFPKRGKLTYSKAILATLPFFFFVLAMTSIDQRTPQRYPPLGKEEIKEKILREGLLEQSGMSTTELEEIFSNPDVVAYFGRSLFPRYYFPEEGEATAQKTAYSPEPFHRLGFSFVGPFGAGQAVLALDEVPAYFPHAEDVIVIGCKKSINPPHGANIFLDALVVIAFDEDSPVIYLTTSLPCHSSGN